MGSSPRRGSLVGGALEVRRGVLGGAMTKIKRTAHIYWVYEGPTRCQPQPRHFLDVIWCYPRSGGCCWVETTPSTAKTPRPAVRCDAQIRPRGRSSGVGTRVFLARQLPAGWLSEEQRAGGQGRAGSARALEAQGVSGWGAEDSLSALGNPGGAFSSALRNWSLAGGRKPG